MKRNEGSFQSEGLKLFERAWLPDGAPKAVIAIVHGYAEHSGRYEHVAERLVARGCAVYALDLRGHGRSEGRRVFIRSVDEHLADIDRFLSLVRERQPALPLFLLGHSMGGTVVASYLVTGERDLSGAILSAPAIRSQRGSSAIARAVLSILARLFPRLPVARLDSAEISRDPQVVARYDADPLVYRGRMPAGTIAALVRAARKVRADMETISLPLLLMHGTLDTLADPEGSRELYEQAATTDKTLKLYEGLYHEIFNEPEQDDVLGDLVEWLEAHTSS